MTDTLTSIRLKCIEANPEIEWSNCPHCGQKLKPHSVGYCADGHFLGKLEVKSRTIRLADVLLAWREACDPSLWWDPNVLREICRCWDLRNDDVSNLARVDLEFIAKQLRV